MRKDPGGNAIEEVTREQLVKMVQGDGSGEDDGSGSVVIYFCEFRRLLLI